MKQMTKVYYFILLKFKLLNLSEHAYVLAKSFSHVKISWTSQIFSVLCFKYQIIQNFGLKKKQKFESAKICYRVFMNPSVPRNNGHFESCIIHKQGMVRLNLLFRGC